MDFKGALAMVGILMKMLGTDYDTKDLDEKSVQIDELTAKVKEIGVQEDRDSLNYIR